jgi:divalent metal cation (Fe/Co/Zn/Cd) transporter|tara:strand:- start:209 stop:373 length:165 start_codon:yes stop_codon:yes gene_type:complete
MIKYIVPAIIIFLIVLFWEKITEFVEKKFNIKLNYIAVSAAVVAIVITLLLLNY